MLKVDVIIPAFHPGERFRQLIARLEKQTYPVNRIIVMNTVTENEKQPEIPADMAERTEITVVSVPQAEFDHGGTRKQAARLSDADVFICMTQDALPADSKLIEELIKALTQREDVAAAYARQLPEKDCNLIERYTRQFNYGETAYLKGSEDIERLGIKTWFCSNVCAAYKKELYERLGGFVEHTVFNEDMIYAAKAVKAGFRIAYAAGARVIHSHNYTALQQLRRNFDLGVSHIMYPEAFGDVPVTGEGVKLVKKTAAYLCKNNPFLLPKLFLNSAAKLTGYRLGRLYQKLPRRAVLWLTMQKYWWK